MTDKVRDQLEDFIIRARFASPKPTITDLVDEVVDEILEKFDITEKPEPEAPVGTVRVNKIRTAVYVKASAAHWIAVYNNGSVLELDNQCGPWGDTEVFRP
ncbi:hypothetical protein SEA_BONES_65 [Mycobacterium phage Bones]|nr:hypothetical protein SEA_BONES_65 [Mycobacterium phage Bones]UJD21263.1 hypothetical protein SEA_EYEBALL_68 [Mycobacterium phage Eyeball]